MTNLRHSLRRTRCGTARSRGLQIGRSAVVNEVRRGYADTDTFESRHLHVHCHDETSATARIRNIATRAGKHLDSIQTLYIHVADDAVTAIRIEVDDPEAVGAFWGFARAAVFRLRRAGVVGERNDVGITSEERNVLETSPHASIVEIPKTGRSR